MTAYLGPRRIRERVRAFIRGTRAGATAIASAAATVMTVGATAVITDHIWLYDHRDTLKTAAEAAAIAAALEIDRQLAKDPDIGTGQLKDALKLVAKRYALANLAHLESERFDRAKDTLKVKLKLDRPARTVGVTLKADLGGTLFSRSLPLLESHTGPDKVAARAGVESEFIPAEVVLAVDVSGSMEANLDPYPFIEAGKGRIDIVRRATRHLVAILNPNAHNRVAVGIVPWNTAVRLDTQTATKWERKGWVLPAGTPAWQGCFDGHLRIDAGIPRVPALTAAALLERPRHAPFVSATCTPQIVGFEGSNIIWGYMSALFPLSTDPDDILDAVDALDVSGQTHSSLGVLWAQRMLEPAWKRVWGRSSSVHPADPSTPEYAKMRKAIVLLTDGQDTTINNTISRDVACGVAKSRGTEIFVTAAMNPRFVSGRLADELRACSSEADDEDYYPAGTRRPRTTYVFLNNATPEALEAAFASIANQLRKLRKVS